ncbi:MAG TPA: ABC transporter permease [Vicinamibacteria bacterium]|jgi:lipoprotein-releasing system permease protein|nr:ABC transporter permease [Vicinamibacteria bacterium]
MPFELRIALRYLTARRKQAFISVISAISVLGVVVGVMALMVALGLMTGLQREIRSKILGATAHISIFRSGNEPFDNYREVVKKARAVPRVLGVAPTVYGKGLMTTAGGSAVAMLKGIVPAQERTVTDLASQVVEGQLDALDHVAEGSLPPVLLGRDLASTLGVGVGDVVSVTSPNGRLSPYGMVPSMKKFRVAGTVYSGLYEFDAQWAYIPLSVAQRLFTEGSDSASLVEVRLDDIYAVRAVAPHILAALGEGYLTTDWIMMNQSLFSALWLEKVAIGITIGLIVMVAALNIVATLILLVMEKHKDIAILVSMGASRGAITRIFMLQGTVIGALGTLTGAVLGWGLCRVLDHYKLIRVPVDVYQVSYVPFTLLPLDAATVIVGAVLICFLATIHPARGASRLDPAEALRYE